jgi:Fur family transcriptional regulator, ferric uptake regulator
MGFHTGHGDWAEATTNALRGKGLHKGGARQAVIDLLAAQTCCLSAQEIFDELRASPGRPVGIASVYRILDLLTAEGFVQRIELGSGVARYEPAWPDGHHHHLVCDSCGKVEAFEDPALEQALDRVETNSGYAIVAHDVVLHGSCNDCR